MACSVPDLAPSWAPDWVFCPQDKILSVVVEWIVSGFIVAGNWVVETVAAPYDAVVDALVAAGSGVAGAGADTGDALLNVATEINGAILDVAASTGPAAPFVTVLLFGVVVLGLLLLLRALVEGYKKVRIWLI